MLLTVSLMLYIASSWLIYFIIESLYILITFTRSISSLMIQTDNLLFAIRTSALPKCPHNPHGIYLVIPCFLLLFVYTKYHSNFSLSFWLPSFSYGSFDSQLKFCLICDFILKLQIIQLAPSQKPKNSSTIQFIEQTFLYVWYCLWF